MKSVLQVKGMKCGGCENTVRTALQSCDGVMAVRPDHKTDTVEVEFDDTRISLEAIKKAITDQGFQVA